MEAIRSYRKKELNHNNKQSKSSNTIQDKNITNTHTLEIMLRFVCSSNKLIRRTNIVNLKHFIDSIDESMYKNDQTKSKLINLISIGIDGRIKYNLEDRNMIISYIVQNFPNNTNLDNLKELNNSEISWINDMISTSLKYDVLIKNIDSLINVATDFKKGDYIAKEQQIAVIEKAISKVQEELRKANNETESEMMFSLENGVFEENIHTTYTKVSNPKRKIITGMQGLNEILGGGFEQERCYIVFGLPGEGKSTLLLNILYQLKKYNKDYVCKDPTKKPCVILLTMENLITESTERLFSISTNRENMIDYDESDIVDMMKSEGELYLNEDSPINIFIKYKPSNSVDTSYLYTLCDKVEDMGFEPICFIQDYVARIHSIEQLFDVRLELGHIIDEFKTFASFKKIPVITAAQLNRTAAKNIDEGRRNNSNDLVNMLGRDNIAESLVMLNNADAGYTIAPEYSSEGIKYLGIKRIKIRYNASDTTQIYLPYMGNSIKLVEDEGRPVKWKKTLRDNTFGSSFNSMSNQYGANPINNKDKDKKENNDDGFSDITFIGSDANMSISSGHIYPIIINPFSNI